MQELCNLADTGSNTILYTALAGSLLLIATILIIYLKTNTNTSTNYRYRGGSLSLLLLAGLALAFILAPTAAFAQTTNPDCDPTSQSGNNQGGGNSGGNQASITCPTNWIVVPGNPAYSTTDFCVMKYTAKNSGGTVASSNDINGDGSFLSNTYSGGTAVSTPTDQPWTNISQTDAITASQTAGTGAHLLTENEWMTIAHNILLQPANWCDADGSNCGNAPGTAGKVLASGHNDSSPNFPLESSTNDAQACYGTVTANVNTACGADPSTQKRTLTLSNGSVLWDLVGNVLHWTSGTATKGDIPNDGAGSGGGFEYNLNTGLGLPVVGSYNTLSYINPAVQNPAAASWGVAQGLGILNSDFSTGSPGVVGFLRGGYWVVGPASGAFTLSLENAPSGSFSPVGFRAAL